MPVEQTAPTMDQIKSECFFYLGSVPTVCVAGVCVCVCVCVWVGACVRACVPACLPACLRLSCLRLFLTLCNALSLYLSLSVSPTRSVSLYCSLRIPFSQGLAVVSQNTSTVSNAEWMGGVKVFLSKAIARGCGCLCLTFTFSFDISSLPACERKRDWDDVMVESLIFRAQQTHTYSHIHTHTYSHIHTHTHTHT